MQAGGGGKRGGSRHGSGNACGIALGMALSGEQLRSTFAGHCCRFAHFCFELFSDWLRSPLPARGSYNGLSHPPYGVR
jgi:hypothetical protein